MRICNALILLLLMELRHQSQFAGLTVCIHTEEQKGCEVEPHAAPQLSLTA